MIKFMERHADSIIKDVFRITDCPYDLKMMDCMHRDADCLTCVHNTKVEIDSQVKYNGGKS